MQDIVSNQKFILWKFKIDKYSIEYCLIALYMNGYKTKNCCISFYSASYCHIILFLLPNLIESFDKMNEKHDLELFIIQSVFLCHWNLHWKILERILSVKHVFPIYLIFRDQWFLHTFDNHCKWDFIFLRKETNLWLCHERDNYNNENGVYRNLQTSENRILQWIFKGSK